MPKFEVGDWVELVGVLPWFAQMNDIGQVIEVKDEEYTVKFQSSTNGTMSGLFDRHLREARAPRGEGS